MTLKIINITKKLISISILFKMTAIAAVKIIRCAIMYCFFLKFLFKALYS